MLYVYSYVCAKCLTYILFLFSVIRTFTNYIYMSLYNRGGLYYFISAIYIYTNETKKNIKFCRQRSKMPRSPRSFLWAMEFKSRNVYFFIVLLCTGHQRKKKELHYLIHFSVQLIILFIHPWFILITIFFSCRFSCYYC